MAEYKGGNPVTILTTEGALVHGAATGEYKGGDAVTIFDANGNPVTLTPGTGGDTITSAVATETPASESLSGTAANQKAVNEENKTAIEALQTDVTAAADVTYDNTTSGLTATDTQAAIDELKASIGANVVYATNNTGDVIPAGYTVRINNIGEAVIATGNDNVNFKNTIEGFALTSTPNGGVVPIVSRYEDTTANTNTNTIGDLLYLGPDGVGVETPGTNPKIIGRVTRVGTPGVITYDINYDYLEPDPLALVSFSTQANPSITNAREALEELYTVPEVIKTIGTFTGLTKGNSHLITYGTARAGDIIEVLPSGTEVKVLKPLVKFVFNPTLDPSDDFGQVQINRQVNGTTILGFEEDTDDFYNTNEPFIFYAKKDNVIKLYVKNETGGSSTTTYGMVSAELRAESIYEKVI